MGNSDASVKKTQSLRGQLTQTHQLLALLQEILSDRRLNAPHKTFEYLNQIGENLAALSRQVDHRERSNENLLALVSIGQIINSSLELNEVMRIAMDTIIRLTNAERGFLMLREENGNLAIRIARNWEQESVNPSEFAISRTVINRVIAEGRPVLTTNAQEDPRFGGHESIVAYNLRSILCVPLKIKSEITGVIYTDNRIHSGIFTENERDLLNAFANQSAVAIENARLFASVRASLSEVSELKNLMDNIFASIANGVITVDSEDRVTLCNRAAADILGHSRQELLGQHLDTIFPDIAAELGSYVNRVRQEQRTMMGVELTPNLRHRGEIELRMNLSPLIDAGQSPLGIAIVLDDLTEKRRLEGSLRLFSRMVSPAVIEQLNPDEVELGGERTRLTTLFTDIRGFTHLSEQISPEELVNILNMYLSAAADAILNQRGTIDKFMGDSVMAWFNAPIAQEDHALRAVRAALDIQAATQSLHDELPEEFHLVIGTGIHTGDVVLGLIGTQERLDYTAIGDSVNTAKRIQEHANDGQILISADIYDLVCDQVIVKPLDEITVKGKSQPLQVYEVCGLKNESARGAPQTRSL